MTRLHGYNGARWGMLATEAEKRLHCAQRETCAQGREA